jgi:glycolate oxidase
VVAHSTRDHSALVKRLVDRLGAGSVLYAPEDVIVFEYDFGLDRHPPDLVVVPRTTEEVVAIMRLAAEYEVPVIPRGAGTGISGGAVPVEGGLVLSLTRMNRILEIDVPNRRAHVQPGVVNLDVSKAAEVSGLFFAPDPSSQKASTIGGNVANNAGGPHCLAYGVTANHVLGLELVLPDGTVTWCRSTAGDAPGYDLSGLVVGAEGTVGVVTSILLRLLPKPEGVRTLLAIFESVDDASAATSAIIAAGIIPVAMEMIDQLALRAVEESFHAGYPMDAGAVLLVEVEGLREELEYVSPQIERILDQHGAREIRVAQTEPERALLWAGRKGAASAMGRVAPNYYLHDAVVARSKLPRVMRKVLEIGARHNLPVANIFHAGDGNLHPMILFDVKEPGVLERVLEAGREMLRMCVDEGGAISGEHGIGVEKRDFMPWYFSEADLETQTRVRRAFDPHARMNPAKVVPTPTSCADTFVRPQRVPVSAELWV